MASISNQRIVGLYEDNAAAWDVQRGRELFEKPWLDRFCSLLPPGAEVLDVGCGMGEPIAAYLISQGFALTGVDSSSSLVELARARFPAHQWLVCDMRALELGRGFDGLLAWHSFFHLSPTDQRPMFERFASHLSPGGVLMFTSGWSEGEAIGEWQGEPLYHGSLDTAEYRTRLEAEGFEVLEHVVNDPDCGYATIWLARKRGLAMTTDALLARSWSRAWQGLGASGEGMQLREELLAAWSESQRRYHTLRHLVDCLVLLEPELGLASHSAEVEMALWFHDAVYDPRAPDNEQRSADWAGRTLSSAGVDAASRSRVHALVMATRHAVEPRGPDEQLLVDVDLSILGAGRERFDEYEIEISEEYAWVPGPVFRHKRRKILDEFLARPRIYSTPAFRERFEVQARANLARAKAALLPWWRAW